MFTCCALAAYLGVSRSCNAGLFVCLHLAVIFLVFGIVLVVFSAKVKDHLVRYDTKCTAPVLPVAGASFTPSKCYVSLSIPETMDGPVFVYYELDNFYQNHRRYVKSKNVNQLQGDSVSSSDISDCSPIQYNSDLRKYRVINSALADSDLASPCGLIAASFFNGIFIKQFRFHLSYLSLCRESQLTL